VNENWPTGVIAAGSDPDVFAASLAEFGKLDVTQAVHLLSMAGDIVFALNSEGIILDRVVASRELPDADVKTWPGKAFADVATIESRAKIKDMIRDALNDRPARWRQINHPTHTGIDIPVRYALVKVGEEGHIVAVGRDMTPIAVMQQRLVSAELAIEQDYTRLRNAEARYRLMMQVTAEAFFIVDGRTGRITDTNPAAADLLNKPLKRLLGSVFVDAFSGSDAEKVTVMIGALASIGQVDNIALTLDGDRQAMASATVLREDNAVYYVIRLFPLTAGSGGTVVPRAKAQTLSAIDVIPDAFVITDMERRILAVNPAFLELAQLGSEAQTVGEPLDRWLGRVGVDMSLLFTSLSDNGVVRQFSTVMRGQFGTVEDVEVSGGTAREGTTPIVGFVIRRVLRPSTFQDQTKPSLMRSVDEMMKLVGKVPLKDIVRETTDIIERLCIEAALQLNNDNRASSADMLGLSRQSFYVKLHRFGISERRQFDQD